MWFFQIIHYPVLVTVIILLFKRKTNIFDNMMAIMEKYAITLESQVAERTHLLMEEKKKTDALLYSMLPRYIGLNQLAVQTLPLTYYF